MFRTKIHNLAEARQQWNFKTVLPHTLASFARIYLVFVYFYSDFCQWQLPEQIFTRQQCNFKTVLSYNLAPFAHTFSFCFILLFFVNQKIFLCFISFTIIFLGQSATGNNPPPPPATLPFYKCCSTFADILLTESAIQIPSTTIIILPPLHWYSVFLLRTDILHTLSPMNELIFHSINKEEDNIVNTKAQQACLQPMKVPIRGKLTPEQRWARPDRPGWREEWCRNRRVARPQSVPPGDAAWEWCALAVVSTVPVARRYVPWWCGSWEWRRPGSGIQSRRVLELLETASLIT